MLLQPPQKRTLISTNKIRVDVNNEGFTADEMREMAGAIPQEFKPHGERGLADFVKKVWGKDRPPQIRDLKSEFGYQAVPLLTDLIAVAEAEGTPLEGQIRASAANYNFYLLRCGVFIEPKDGEKFEALKFQVRYKHPNASTYTMLPGPQTKTILKMGGTARLGIDGKGEFGFPRITLPQQGVAVGASVDAELKGKFIVNFEYELKTEVVDAYGVGNRSAKWVLHKGDKLRNDVLFYPVIMTPKSVKEFDCEFSAYFKIDHPKWTNAEYFLKPSRTIRVPA